MIADQEGFQRHIPGGARVPDLCCIVSAVGLGGPAVVAEQVEDEPRRAVLRRLEEALIHLQVSLPGEDPDQHA
jgi:hypothetical protein